MKDWHRIAIVAVCLIIWALMAGFARGQEVGTIHFYQAEPPDVDAWDFQILYGEWTDLDMSGSIVDPCVGCWQVDFSVPDSGYVRSRAIAPDGTVSDWSHPIVVPEPSTGLGLMVGVAWLVAIRREASPRRLHQPS